MLRVCSVLPAAVLSEWRPRPCEGGGRGGSEMQGECMRVSRLVDSTGPRLVIRTVQIVPIQLAR